MYLNVLKAITFPG